MITGGSSGIVLATAKLFQHAGAKVAISGRNQKSLDDAAKELGPKTIALRSDVSRSDVIDLSVYNVLSCVRWRDRDNSTRIKLWIGPCVCSGSMATTQRRCKT